MVCRPARFACKHAPAISGSGGAVQYALLWWLPLARLNSSGVLCLRVRQWQQQHHMPCATGRLHVTYACSGHADPCTQCLGLAFCSLRERGAADRFAQCVL